MTNRSIGRAGLLALLFALAGCADTDDMAEIRKRRPAPTRINAPSYWNDEGAKGMPLIIINLTEQRAYFYKGKHLVGESTIPSGRKGFETPPGDYKVIQKDEHHVSNLYGEYINEDEEIVARDVDVTKDPMPDGTEFRGARMDYFLRFSRGYGMHAGNVPRYRASHGCVRLPRKMAERFFQASLLGTPVIVEP